MAEDKTFLVSILDESGAVYYGRCRELFVPTDKDTIAILKHHTPIIAKLGAGNVSIREANGSRQVVTTIKSGLLYVGNDEATVLINL